MALATNIVLYDAAGTPVAHTFVPLGRDPNGVFWFEDQSQVSPVGFWRISVDFKRPPGAAPGQSTTGRQYKAKISLYEPALETVSNSTVSGIAPSPQIAYNMVSHTEFRMPERGTLQNRKDLRKMMAGLLADTQIISVVEGLNYLS